MEIHDSADIHRTAVIEGNVKIGPGTRIGPFCYIKGDVVIGSNNNICAHVVIGEGPEHRRHPGGVGAIHIGDNNVIREMSVVQRGIGDRETFIGNDCYLMDHCHVAHDCYLGNGVTMAPNTVLAGHVRIHEGATVGINVAIHQFSTIGAYSMIGMGSVITKDVFPFVVISGAPGKYQRMNSFHFEKFGIGDSEFFVENGRLMTHSPRIKKMFDQFYEDSRRGKFVSISDESVSAT